MHLRRELWWTIGSLALLNLLLALGAIGLFNRMGPAIERILQENVYSIVAAEDMLLVLAQDSDASFSAEELKRMQEALARAKKNTTEPEEGPILNAIEKEMAALVRGEPGARTRTCEQLQHFIRINRDAMLAVDLEAQRLSTAGAWAAVFIGFLAFLMSLFVFRRLQKRVVNPLFELVDVLQSALRGVRLRRCRTRDVPLEVLRVSEAVNQLLDERLTGPQASDAPSPLLDSGLSKLLEMQPTAAALVDRDGNVVRANQAMLSLIAGDDKLRLRSALTDDSPSRNVVHRTSLRDHGWLVTVPDAGRLKDELH